MIMERNVSYVIYEYNFDLVWDVVLVKMCFVKWYFDIIVKIV